MWTPSAARSFSTAASASATDSLIVLRRRDLLLGHDAWHEVSCGLKTLADVADLRSRFFAAFEEAERAEDDAARAEWLTFVVIGGGPTGVEVAGQLAITALTMKHGFLRTKPTEVRVILLDAGDRLVAAFDPKLSKKVAAGLADLGVTVREGARATAIDARGVTIQLGDAGERIDARTVILWAAGVHAVPVADALARATGATTDRGGRVQVTPELAVPGHPEISVVGDVAGLDGTGREATPGLATGHPAGPPRGPGHRQRRAGSHLAVQVPRQGSARGRRPLQGGMRGQGSPALGSARLLDLSGRASLSPRGPRGGASRSCSVDRSGIRQRRAPLVEGRLDEVERVPPSAQPVR